MSKAEQQQQQQQQQPRRYVCSIDQGTSSSRFMVFNRDNEVVCCHQREHKQHYPQPGHVEHDAEEIWESVRECVISALSSGKVDSSDLAALGITNQRETTCVWNKHTGVPYYKAIVWNDNRTSDICDRFKEYKELVRAKTGLPVAPYFSCSKLIYLLENVSGLRAAAENGDALFGTIDTWLTWKLTAGKVFATDVTNASRTLLMNLETLEWDDELLALFDIPKAMLPEIKSSSEVYGVVESISELHNVPIAGVLGDQHAALFGQTCFHVGEAKCTYGTGAFLLMNIGEKIVPSARGLLSTVAFQIGGKDKPCFYALEGSVAYCGSLIQWLRDNMQILNDASESQELAANDNGGVYFVPAFGGLFAPYWRPDARGIIVGLTAFNTKAHIIRAALEAASFQAKEVLEAMQKDSGIHLVNLKVDGGMTKNALAMQFQCDLLGVSLACPVVAETTALGAAFAAGLGVGYWASVEELKSSWKLGKSWSPKMDVDKRNFLTLHWRKAIARTLHWVEPQDEVSSSHTLDPHLALLIQQGQQQQQQLHQQHEEVDEERRLQGLGWGGVAVVTLVSIGLGYFFGTRQRR